jgi:Tfp pilus assembly protein PilF/peroxiredoxin
VAQAPGAEDTSAAESTASSNRDFSKLVERGRSFSGRERHCCFLNTGGAALASGRFANISAASGLDLLDDGRGVAMVDWDQDGDLDLWISNRNAPRLRLLRNEFATGNHFLQIRLIGNGDDTNRDAIGARVEVSVLRSQFSVPGSEDNREPRTSNRELGRLTNTLRAGEGFLSQSGPWLHYGLGDADQVEKVIVHWPMADGPGRVEEFTGFHVDQRYKLVQGSGKAREVPARVGKLEMRPSSPQIATQTENARIPLDIRLPLPDHLKYSDLDGHQRVARSTKGKHLLINLWASHCVPCVRELTEFKQHSEALKQAGIEILALSVDGLDADASTEIADAKRTIERIQVSFAVGRADTAHVSLLQNYHDFVISQNRLLPIPSSFLLDKQGRISVIYKGTVSIKQLIEDVNLVSTQRPLDQLRYHALLPGSIVEHGVTNHSALSRAATTRTTLGKALLKMRSNTGLDQLGQLAVDQFAKVAEMLPTEGDAHNDYGWALVQVGQMEAARARLKKAIEIDGSKSRYHANLGFVLENLGDVDGAAKSYQLGLASEDDNPHVHFLFGNFLFRQKKHDEALKYYLRAVELNKDFVEAEHRLGTLFALRGESERAIQHYQRACKLAPNFAAAHHHLGVVLASQGQLAAAVKHLQQAVDLNPQNAQAINQLEMARRLLEGKDR